MELVTKNVMDLKKLITPLNKRYEMLELEFTKQGISIQETDNAMVEVVTIKIDAGFFEVYQLDEEFKISIRTEDLYNILKGFDKNSWLEIERIENKLVLYEKGVISGKTEISIIERSKEEVPEINSLEFDTQFVAENLDKVVSKIAKETDSIQFDFLNGKLAIGEKSIVDLKDLIQFEQNFNGQARSKYPIDYLKTFLKLTKFVKVQMKTDYPAKLTYNMNYITLQQVIAPRVSE